MIDDYKEVWLAAFERTGSADEADIAVAELYADMIDEARDRAKEARSKP